MKFEAATIKDIAKALGISTSTVSRALRGSYEISNATKEQVLQYARSINYKPNPIALSLKTKASKSIGIIVAEIANTFFSQVINGVETVASENGYNVIIAQSLESYESEVANINFLSSRAIDGCLVSVSAETHDFFHFNELQEKGFPIVFFDRIVEELQGHTVTIDNVQATYEGTIHLLQNGYRKIAFLGVAPNLFITAKRLEGYRKALAEYSINYDESLVKYCLHDGLCYDEIEMALDELFYLSEPPDAVFASADKLTTSCMRYCGKLGIKIPGDIGLAGFSNLDITDLLYPSLTVIRQPALEMGKSAAQLLINTIEAKKPVIGFERHVLPVDLLIGESSKSRKEESLACF